MGNDHLKINGMHDGAIPEILRNAARLRLNMTAAEIMVWDFLKQKPLDFKFRRQHLIHRYILDFYCHKLRLSIEVDGGYHLNAEQKEKDKERTTYLDSVGIKEIRFSNKEVKANIEKVQSIIEDELSRDTPLGAGGENEQSLIKK